MGKQQEVIKAFMASLANNPASRLERNADNGISVLDEAVRACSSFNSVQDVIDNMIKNRDTAGSGNNFLKNYCGIDIKGTSNEDTGAITGSDAGGLNLKTATTIIQENRNIISYAGNEFTVNGLTLKLARFDSEGRNPQPISFYDLNDKQKYIWQGLYTWWAEGALNLIEESYGSYFSFKNASIKTMYVGFTTSDASWFARTPWTDKYVGIQINDYYYSKIKNDSKDGAYSTDNKNYLDRVIAHEFTHSICCVNDMLACFPGFFTEGIAELTHGIDNFATRPSSITDLAQNPTLLRAVLETDNSQGKSPTYVNSAGYIFLRYLAKQGAGNYSKEALFTNDNDTQSNSQSGQTLKALAGNDKIVNKASNVTMYGGTGNDTIESWNVSNVKIYGETGDDYLQNASGSYVTMDGGSDNDAIYNDGTHASINAGDGNDSVRNWSGHNSKIELGAGSDSNTNENSSSVTINGGDDDDIIHNVNGSNYASIDGDYGNDFIWNENSQYVTINGGYGEDSIRNYSSQVKMYGGDGNDSMSNNADSVTIDGGYGNDFIHNNDGSYSSIRGGAGNDTIRNESSGHVTISGDSGNDIISIDGSSAYTFIQYAAGEGNDTIYGAHSGDTLKITNGSYSSIKTDSDLIVYVGDNTILFKGNPAIKIDGSYSSDGKSVSNSNSYTTLYGSGGNDTVNNWGNNVTIKTAEGNDEIFNADSGHDNLIEAGDGNDNISNYASYVTINGGNGNDTIYNNSSNILYRYNSGDGNDTIYGIKSNDTLQITGVKYSRSTVGNDLKINVGNGSILLKDAINTAFTSVGTLDTSNPNSNTVISGSSGNDSIYLNNASYVTINGGNGNDTVTGNYYNSKIYGGTGNDYISITDDDAYRYSNALILSKYLRLTNSWTDNLTTTIDGGDGEDTVNIVGFSPVSINGGNGNDKISLSGDYGFLPSRTVQGGKGNDIIYGVSDIKGDTDALRYNGFIGTYYEYSYGDGSDVIYNYHSNDTISIAGNSSYTTLTSGDNIIVSVIGSGSITLYNDAYNSTKNKKVSILGGKYDDTANLTIGGGTGSQTLGGGTEYSISGGVLTVFDNFSGNKIDLANYSGATKVNAAVLSKNVSIIGTASANSLKGGSGNDTIYSGGGNDTLTGGIGNDIFVYSSSNDIITDYTAGEDKIKLSGASITGSSISGSNVILKTSSGNITVQNGKNKNITVIDSKGKETTTIYNGNSINTLLAGISIKSSVLTASSSFTGSKIDLADYPTATKVNASALNKAVSIVGSAANNSLKGGKGADTIFGGSGNDTVSLGGGTDVYIYSSGNDLIQDYTAGADKIKLSSGSINSASVSGSNVILKTSSGNITVKGGKGKNITIIDSKGKETTNIYPLSTLPAGISIKSSVLTASTAFTGNKIDLINYTGATKVNASTLSKAISIVGTAANNSLKGGKGADTLRGGNGNDTLTGGAGNDVFAYEGGNDVITDYKPNEDTVKLNPSAITNSSVKGSDVILTTSNGTLTIKGTKDKVIKFVDDNGNTSEKIFFADTSYTPLETGLTYDAKRTVLTASNKFTGSKIDLGEYLPTVIKVNVSAVSQVLNIVGNTSANSIKGGKSADAINGGDGKDTIFGGAGNDSIYGGNDNDKLQGDAGNDTLNGGLGNDTLTGGAGNDVFVYEGGNDVITDYAAGQDSIKVNGTISNVSYNGKNVIFTIGNSSLTVNNAKGKKITVTSNNNQTQTYSKTLDLMYDNNFVADEFGIDEISKITETNYAVGEIEYSSNNNELSNNSIVPAASFDEK